MFCFLILGVSGLPEKAFFVPARLSVPPEKGFFVQSGLSVPSENGLFRPGEAFRTPLKRAFHIYVAPTSVNYLFGN